MLENENAQTDAHNLLMKKKKGEKPEPQPQHERKDMKKGVAWNFFIFVNLQITQK